MFVLKTRKDAILKPLQAIIGVVDKKHTLPILSNVLLECGPNAITLTATDLELQITTWLEGTAEEQNDYTVSARKLFDIVRALPDDTDVSLSLEKEQVKLKAGRSRFSLQTLPAKDFPKLKESETEGMVVHLPQGRLRHLLARVQYAMAIQDIRYYLNGMLFSLQGNRLTMAATDGHRLALDATDLDTESNHSIDVILPRKTVIELIKLLNESEDPVEIRLGNNQIVFKHSNFELRSKVVDGKFPDYQRVIPSGYVRGFDLERQGFHKALNRAAILTNEKYRGVRLVLTNASLRITCSNNEQEEAQEELEVDYQDEALDIGFNVQYLQDVLNNLDCEKIHCGFGDANSSMLITIPGEENFRYVVMPMRI